MLLLHHNQHVPRWGGEVREFQIQDFGLGMGTEILYVKTGSPAWTRTTTSGLTGRHCCFTSQEKKNGVSGWTRTSSFRLRRAACRTLTLRKRMKIGAPCRFRPGTICLEDRHAAVTSMALVKKAAGAGIAPASVALQATAHLSVPSSEVEMLVLPRGIAPRSSGYRPGALLLSYGRELERWKLRI